MHENGETTTVDIEAARDALEKFVMENDELLELEARIGRFNIFDALGIVNAEIRHSNFLGWLLDPAESHGAGDLFLKAVLMDMLRQTDQELRPEGVSPIHLDGATITSVEIRREWKNIDLLIRCESPTLVIAIENKIRAGEHGGQLVKYKKIVREAFSDEPSMFVFLTREGDDPSDEDWTTYSYAQLKTVLERVRKTNEGAIGEDVDTFLDHYLHLIESRLTDDEAIDDLCRKIYKNHRQALDLLIDRAGNASSELLALAEELLAQHPDRWHVFQAMTNELIFVPRSWLDVVPAIGTLPNRDERSWLYLYFWVHKRQRRCGLRRAVHAVNDNSIREWCIRSLIQDESGFRRKNPKLNNGWNSLGKTEVYTWKSADAPDLEQVRKALTKHLDRLWEEVKDSHLVIQNAVNSAGQSRGAE